MGLFDRFIGNNMDALVKGKPEDFAPHFKGVAERLSLKKKKETVGHPTINKKQFEALWGIPMPDDLEAFLTLLLDLGLPKLYRWQTAIPDSSIVEEEGNIVKKVLLQAQIEYPTDHHVGWFSGTVAMDAIRNPNRSSWQGNTTSYLYPLFDTTTDRESHLYSYEHGIVNLWNMNVAVLARDLSSLLYVVLANEAFQQKKITQKQFATCMGKLRGRVHLPYNFFNPFYEGNQWVSPYQVRFNLNSRNRSTQPKYAHEMQDRAMWILILLKGDFNMADESVWWNLKYAYRDWVNPSTITAEMHRQNMEQLPHHVPHALYYLFRCFFKSENSQLNDYIEVCKESPSRIIRDAALLVEEFRDGLTYFGEVSNIQELKRRYANTHGWKVTELV